MSINLLDCFVILLTVTAFIRGLQAGLVRQLFPLAGLFLGLYLGAMLAPEVQVLLRGLIVPALIDLVVILGTAFVLGAVGTILGDALSRVTLRFQISWVDSLLGAITGAAMTLLTYWLIASVLFASPPPAIGDQVQNSLILRVLDDRLPPAPSVIARLGNIINASGLPPELLGALPAPAAPVTTPAPADVALIVSKTAASVVKVAGAGCGGLNVGSGFVVAPNLVITNAHVVAGVRRPAVLDRSGSWHRATPVLYDPDTDLAALRTTGLTAPPLALATDTLPRSTTGAVEGYPGGGSFSAVPAGILELLQATGRNIYDQKDVTRQVYELQALVEQGNSGGPFLLADGRVAGVVFARSASSNQQVGYALTAAQVQPDIAQAEGSTGRVDTGQCIAE